jgi:hypothetical protein
MPAMITTREQASFASLSSWLITSLLVLCCHHGSLLSTQCLEKTMRSFQNKEWLRRNTHT